MARGSKHFRRDQEKLRYLDFRVRDQEKKMNKRYGVDWAIKRKTEREKGLESYKKDLQQPVFSNAKVNKSHGRRKD
tara:strand:- start:412 stop:639 length:228 start_codon:yes stop_codon:yes gene_type:complete